MLWSVLSETWGSHSGEDVKSGLATLRSCRWYLHFRGTHCFYLQPEYRGDMFLWNGGNHLQDNAKDHTRHTAMCFQTLDLLIFMHFVHKLINISMIPFMHNNRYRPVNCYSSHHLITSFKAMEGLHPPSLPCVSKAPVQCC